MDTNISDSEDVETKMLEGISQMKISTPLSPSQSLLFNERRYERFGIGGVIDIPCKRAKMIEGLKVVPVPIMGDDFESELISPPESPLTGCANDEGLRSVFRRIGDEEADEIPMVQQYTPRRKNTGLSISTTLEWQPTEDTPVAPKHKRHFKSFWADFLPGLSTDNAIQPADSFSIGCGSTTKKKNKHGTNRLTICRRLRKVIQIQTNDDNKHELSNSKIIPTIYTSSTIDSSFTYFLQQQESDTTTNQHKRKAANGNRLSKFRIRNSEHFASL